MQDVAVIEAPEAARVILDPIRSQILSALASPGSASTVAEHLGIARQKVNYHLRLLEDHGLIQLLEERPRRGLTERVMQATATSYAVAPSALGACSSDIDSVDELSSSYLIALGARLVGEVGALVNDAGRAGQSLATLSIDTELTFATPDDRAAFAHDLASAITELVATYHSAVEPAGRSYRLVVGAHPLPSKEQQGSTR